MSRWLLVLLMITLASLAGCSAAVKMAPVSDDTPGWVNGPSTFENNGYICAVGLSGSMKNVALARTAAETNGRAVLLRFLKSGPVINGQKYTEADQVMVTVPAFWRNYGTGVTYALVRCRIEKK